MNSKSKAPFQRSLARDFATILPRKKSAESLCRVPDTSCTISRELGGFRSKEFHRKNHWTPEVLFLKSRKSNLGWRHFYFWLQPETWRKRRNHSLDIQYEVHLYKRSFPHAIGAGQASRKTKQMPLEFQGKSWK